MNAFENLQYALEKYPQLEECFTTFCGALADTVNGNAQLPGMVITTPTARTIHIAALNRQFEITFDITMHNGAPLGILKASLPSAFGQAPITLTRAYFDDSGDVKEDLAKPFSYHLKDKEFLTVFLGSLGTIYFAHINHALSSVTPC